MAKKAHAKRQSTLVPPSPYDFIETVKRVLQVKPPAKPTRKKPISRKSAGK